MKKCTSFEEQKGTRYIPGNVYFGIIVFSCLSPTKRCLRFLLISFAQEIKGFYQSSLRSEVDFRDIMDVSPNILAKNYNFKILRPGLADESTDNSDINILLSLENPGIFLLAKERPVNAFLTLIVNYRKIAQKN